MISDFHLDYHFGWRWLLPIVPGDRVLLLGFADHERTFWKKVLVDVNITESSSKASVWLINELPPGCVAGLDSDQLRSLCVVGTNKIVTAWHRWLGDRFDKVSDFALLPPNNPRVVVPLANKDWTLQGLELHRPGRRLARGIISVLKGLVWLGFSRPLRSRMLCIAGKDSIIGFQGAQQAGLKLGTKIAPAQFALYLGTPDENRKTVIMPVNTDRQIILKQGYSFKAKAALHTEAAALQAMSLTTLASKVPALFDVVV